MFGRPDSPAVDASQILMDDGYAFVHLLHLVFQGRQSGLDVAHVTAHVGDIGANRSQVLQHPLFDIIGHGARTLLSEGRS